MACTKLSEVTERQLRASACPCGRGGCRMLGQRARWPTLMTCLLITFLTAATVRTLGFFYVNFIARFGWTREHSAWPLGVFSASLNLSGIIHGVLSKHLSPRAVVALGGVCHAVGLFFASFVMTVPAMMATFGLLGGLGGGLVFVANGSFLDQKGTRSANVAVFCLAGCFYPKAMLLVRDAHGYDGFVLATAGLLLTVPALSSLLGEPPKVLAEVPEVLSVYAIQHPVCHRTDEFLRNPAFYLVGISYAIFIYSFTLVTSSLIDVAFDRDVGVTYAITIVPAYSLMDLVGRVFVPMLATGGHCERCDIVAVDYVAIGTMLLLLPLSYDYATLLGTCLSFAAFNGSAIAIQSALLGDHVGRDACTLANGLVNAATACAFLTKPVVLGFFRDGMGSYDPMLRSCGTSVLLSGVVWFGVNCARRRGRKGKWKVAPRPARDDVDPHLLSCQFLYAY